MARNLFTKNAIAKQQEESRRQAERDALIAKAVASNPLAKEGAAAQGGK